MTENKYYLVTQAFDAWIIEGYDRSNVHYGAANLLQPRYRTLTLAPGEEVHALVGGTFAVIGMAKRPVEIHLERTDVTRAFERGYGRRAGLPMDRLREIPQTGAVRIKNYRAAK